jgi:deoxyribonuclease V
VLFINGLWRGILMKALHLHRWNVTPAEAREIQLQLRSRLELQYRIPKLSHVAGADIALELHGRGSWRTGEGRAIAGVIVYRFPEMVEVERTSSIQPLMFPYVPGLLSFREIPALLAAFESLRIPPDLIFCDAQGYAHPRRFGLACHLGVLLDVPSIGVAKSLLIGECKKPAQSAGSTAPLLDPNTREQIGALVRTANGVKPVYVSQGHRISLARAIEFTLAVTDGFRIPRPTREADHFVNALRRQRKSLTAAP